MSYGFINDGINLLYQVQEYLVAGVLHPCPSPWDIGELTSGECGADTTGGEGGRGKRLTARRVIRARRVNNARIPKFDGGSIEE